jgi:D-alanine-D-alanine ligase
MSNPACFGKVAVLFGGTSAEREVSLKSGRAVLEALLRQGVDAHGVDVVDNTILETLRSGGFARVFIVLHGRGGEDGVIQGALETLGLPYTGSGVLGSALGMDKVRTKQIWQAAGLPTPKFLLLESASDLSRVEAELGFPVMIKPAHEGSSIGMSKVECAAELPTAWQAAMQYDSAVLAEKWITGREYTASMLGEQALPLIRLETTHAFYDYQAKYFADDTRYHCPCGLPEAEELQLRALAQRAFRAVAARGWGRVDFMCDHNGQPYLIEVNTVPGMTDHSLVPMAARTAGINFEALVLRILEDSLVRDTQSESVRLDA